MSISVLFSKTYDARGEGLSRSRRGGRSNFRQVAGKVGLRTQLRIKKSPLLSLRTAKCCANNAVHGTVDVIAVVMNGN